MRKLTRSIELVGVLAKSGIDLPGAPPGSAGGVLVGDVRLRVDLTALALELGPKAIVVRGGRIRLYNGAVECDGFNKRVEAKDKS
jgi:hypothetical protein